VNSQRGEAGNDVGAVAKRPGEHKLEVIVQEAVALAFGVCGGEDPLAV